MEENVRELNEALRIRAINHEAVVPILSRDEAETIVVVINALSQLGGEPEESREYRMGIISKIQSAMDDAVQRAIEKERGVALDEIAPSIRKCSAILREG